MPKSKNRGHRETRKLQQELPKVPDLGRLSMPRKHNRSAAKYVASVGLLWDRRRADRKAVRNAQVRQDAALANPRRQHLDKTVRLRMLNAMSGWTFDQRAKAFVPNDSAPERIDELLDAVTDLGTDPVVLRISGLSLHEARRVRGYLTKGSTLFVVNARVSEPTFAY
jgi:hypothetical protein